MPDKPRDPVHEWTSRHDDHWISDHPLEVAIIGGAMAAALLGWWIKVHEAQRYVPLLLWARGHAVPLIVAGLLVAAAIAEIVWTVVHRPKHGKITKEWPGLAKGLGLDGAKIVGRDSDKNGQTLKLQLNRFAGQATPDVVSKLPRLEAAVKAHPGRVRVIPDKTRADLLSVRIDKTDPLAKPIPWPGSRMESVKEPMVLGTFGDGWPVQLGLWTPARQQHVLIGGVNGAGKALAVDTPLLTTDGWTTMGEVQVGQKVFGADGRPTPVLAVTPVMEGRPCYELVFSDGTSIIADEEHRWVTSTGRQRMWEWVQANASRKPARLPVGTPTAIAAVGAALDAASWFEPVTVPQLITEFDLPDTAYAWMRTVQYSILEAPIVDPRRRRQNGYQRRIYDRREALAMLYARLSTPISDQRWRLRGGPVTTGEIRDSLRVKGTDNSANHAIPVASPLQLPKRDLPIDPYVLGCWLGDGTSKSSGFTTADPEILDELRRRGMRIKKVGTNSYGYSLSFASPPTPATVPSLCGCGCGDPAPLARQSLTRTGQRKGEPLRFRKGHQIIWMSYRSFTGQLRLLGVFRDKHIPAIYQMASEGQRRDLLAGLMDTDGTVGKQGTHSYTTTSPKLAADVHDLAIGLGIKATMRERPAKFKGKVCGTAYSVNFTTDQAVCRLPRKAARESGIRRSTNKLRYIVDVRPIESVPVRCIQVGNPAGLYLASRALIPTHNSGLINVALGNLSRCRDLAIWGIDMKGGMELAPWRPALDQLATTEKEARALLERANAVLDERMAKLAAERSRRWEPKPDAPLLLIVVDELSELDQEAMTLVLRLARMGRAPGVQLLLATQRPSAKQLEAKDESGAGLRGQMHTRITMRVTEAREVDMILGSGYRSEGFSADRILREPGTFLLVSPPEHVQPRPARAFLMTDEDVQKAVETARLARLNSNTESQPESQPILTDDDRLLAIVADAGDAGILAESIVPEFGKSRPTVFRYLKRLSEQGLVASDKAGRWRRVSKSH